MKEKLNNVWVAVAVMILVVLVPVGVMTLLFVNNFPTGREIMPAFLGSLVLVAVMFACSCVIAIMLPRCSRNLLVLAAGYLPFLLFVVVSSFEIDDLDLSIFMLNVFFLYFFLQFFLFAFNVRYAATMTHLVFYNFNAVFTISMAYAVAGLYNMANHHADIGSKLITMYSYYISAVVGLLVSVGLLFSCRKRLVGKYNS